MARMQVAQISKPHGSFELVEREIPQPGAGQVRIKVEACGVCHSDELVKHGLYPGLQLPRVPGHKISGRHPMEAGAARGRGMARRALLRVRMVPARRFHPVRQWQNHRNSLRWRLR
jgi:hypothetical protein